MFIWICIWWFTFKDTTIKDDDKAPWKKTGYPPPANGQLNPEHEEAGDPQTDGKSVK